MRLCWDSLSLRLPGGPIASFLLSRRWQRARLLKCCRLVGNLLRSWIHSEMLPLIAPNKFCVLIMDVPEGAWELSVPLFELWPNPWGFNESTKLWICAVKLFWFARTKSFNRSCLMTVSWCRGFWGAWVSTVVVTPLVAAAAECCSLFWVWALAILLGLRLRPETGQTKNVS